jgi:hypothetical protein
MKLRKCHCGGAPKMFPKDFLEDFFGDENRHVICDSCGYETLSYCNGNRAQQAWNYLQQNLINNKQTNT